MLFKLRNMVQIDDTYNTERLNVTYSRHIVEIGDVLSRALTVLQENHLA